MKFVRRVAAFVGFLALCAAPHGSAFAQRPTRPPVRRPAPRTVRPKPAKRLTASKWADSIRVAIDDATRAGSLPRFRAARRLVSVALAQYPDEPLLLHYDGFLLYRMITSGAESLDPETVAAMLDDARSALERSSARRPMTETYLLLADIYQRQIDATPSRARSLGPARDLARARAMAMGAKNPRLYLMAGISALYAPAQMGGGPRAAQQLLSTAVDLFAHDRPRPPLPSWGQAEAYAWLGQVNERMGRMTAAEAQYRKALALAPDYVWVREVLLPHVLNGR